ncbi:hypothetical protein ACFLU5_12865 [Bacteroidota bacterium]
MKIYNSIRSGLKFTVQKKGILLLIYTSILVLGIAFSLPIFSSVKNTAGNRLEIQNLLTSFDYTAYQDFMIEFGHIFKPVRSQVKWMVLVFLLLNIFFTGGILQLCQSNWPATSTFGKFMTGGQRHFGKIALTVFLFFLIQGIVALIIWVPAIISLSGGLESKSSEIPYVNTIIFAAILHIILFSFVSMISDYVKVGIVREENSRYFKVFGQQFVAAIKNIGNTYGLFMIHVLLLVILFTFYFILEDLINNDTAASIFLLFIIQQIVIIKRIGLRIFGLSSAWNMNQQILPVKIDSKRDTTSIMSASGMINT